jgi:NAD(P)-dependent dehydrogenase (short-subunit alcohol dehydrogenase family)
MSTEHAVAVVIDGASGIGWATAQLLTERGDTVIVADLDGDAATTRAAELGGRASAQQVTGHRRNSMRTLFDTVTAQHGPLDTIVDCAGVSRPGTLADLSLDDWKATVDVCLTGAFLTVREAARALRDHGSVVLVASLNGRRPGVGAYCSAKAGTPGDIAQTIGFLTSAAAGWMTGAATDLNGGAHTKRYPGIVARIADMAGGQQRTVTRPRNPEAGPSPKVDSGDCVIRLLLLPGGCFIGDHLRSSVTPEMERLRRRSDRFRAHHPRGCRFDPRARHCRSRDDQAKDLFDKNARHAAGRVGA